MVCAKSVFHYFVPKFISQCFPHLDLTLATFYIHSFLYFQENNAIHDPENTDCNAASPIECRPT